VTTWGTGRILPALVLSGALALAGGAADPPGLSATAGRARLRVLYGRYLSSAPLAIANAEGFFRDQGLDVELVHLTGNSEATPALLRGDLDVGAGILKIADFNAIARGGTLRLVADKGHYEPGACAASALMARPVFLQSKDPAGAAHLRGARAATIPLTFSEYVLETFLSSKGLTLSDLRLSRLPEAAAAEALIDGSLDFSHIAEPYLSHVARSGHAVVWIPVQDIVPGTQQATLLFGPTLLEKNRDAGRRFLVAYLRGVRQYNKGKTPRNVEILAAETGLDPELVKGACWQPIRSDGSINLESILAFQRWAVGRGALDAVVGPEGFWDSSFVEAANRSLGPPAP
jgi:NitT/TauT family transport system substrate-binding protein